MFYHGYFREKENFLICTVDYTKREKHRVVIDLNVLK